MLMINQNEYLDVAGKGCLVLSNLLWQNKAAQGLFGNGQVIERIVFLTDFNQLITESDPDASIESL